MNTAPSHFADEFSRQGNPNEWFEAYYASTGGDIHSVVWADLIPGPSLTEWVSTHQPEPGATAVVIGCGLGDDAEFLAQAGYEVTAFDISPTAIGMCEKRWTDSRVHYLVANLFNLPADWHGHFDLIYECNTIQALRGDARVQAVPAIADLLAPGGSLLVSCRYRESTEPEGIMPLPLNRSDLHGFVRERLEEKHFQTYDDDQEPPVPHAFAVYHRPS